MTIQVGYWRELALIGIALCVACDAGKPAPGISTSWDHVCVDVDGDGYGFQCGEGDDCDDSDPELHDGCSVSCRKPAEGCPCEEGAEPVDCSLPYTLDKGGDLLCHTGTRYCRDDVWSGCEGVVTFTAPPPLHGLEHRAVINADAGSSDCGPCDKSCRRIEDKLDTPFTADAGVGTNVSSVRAGGVALTPQISGGAGLPPLTDALLDDVPCITEDRPDCDGLPSPYDSDPTLGPSGTSHKTMFFDVAPGASESQPFQTKALGVNSVDVYLYADASGNTAPVLAALGTAFRAGTFLTDSATITCLDGTADKKAQGIAGNMACVVPDVRFGLGWFRDIPFYGPIPDIDRRIAPWDMEPYEHEHDLSGDVLSVAQRISELRPRSNLNSPEGGMQGLWSIATGGELYMGWSRPGVPQRRGCPAGSFGYPCFRESAIPVVLMLTDAPMQNGPTTSARGITDANCLNEFICDPLDYPAEVLGMSAGSEPGYRVLSTRAESFGAPEPVGVVDGKLLTYVGDTTAMTADYGVANCTEWRDFSELGPDVMFQFSVETRGPYVISARGTRFDAGLMLARLGSDGQPGELLRCADDNVRLGQTEELQVTPEITVDDLEPGEYVVVLKGWQPTARGWFQVSIGQPAAARSGSFGAKRWDGTGGVREALLAKRIRVATIQSGTNAYTREQALKIASATNAVGPLRAPSRGFISSDGTNLGSEVVRVLREVVDNTLLEVSLALDPTSGTNPGFQFLVEAVHRSGDRCSGVVDRDNDPGHVPDTHVDCAKGARPEFRVTITNPTGAPVARNPADPTGEGGYSMWFQVLGDGRQVIDRLHVYAVPRTLRAPVTITYPDSGVYVQSLEADSCLDHEGPLWRALAWEATLPAGTSIRMKVCGADTAALLDAECMASDAREALTLSRGGSCSTDADCGGLGYCARDGSQACYLVTGPSCRTDEDCGAFGGCRGTLGNNHCTNTAEALDLYPVAKEGMQGRRFARVFVELVSDPSHAQTPTLLKWNVTYSCAPL